MPKEKTFNKKNGNLDNKKVILNKDAFSSFKQGWKGLLIAIIAGVIAYLIQKFSGYGVLDPLLVALILGMLIRFFVKFKESSISSFKLAPLILIPAGVIFYGAKNLDFIKFSTIDITNALLLFVIFIIYVTTIIFLSNLFGIREKIVYLTAAGSAICGASAIAITTPAINAESDDVSISLISVFLSQVWDFLFVFPF